MLFIVITVALCALLSNVQWDTHSTFGAKAGRPATPVFRCHTKPYSIVDAINRMAAATGSVIGAMRTAHADFNGHHLSLYWNDYRGYYVLDYQWGERVVLYRGTDFAQGLATALREFGRQGRGATLRVLPDTNADIALCRANAALYEGEEQRPDWMDWRYDQVSAALRSMQQFGLPLALLIDAKSKEEYDAAVKQWYAANRGDVMARAQVNAVKEAELDSIR